MMRWLYLGLLRLHPRRFRERFSEEMVDIFDSEAERRRRGPLLVDALISLFRQWVLRPARHEPALSATVAGPWPRTPVFRILEDPLPGWSALANGAALSLLSFSLVTFALGRGAKVTQLLLGARYARPGLVALDRSSVAEAELTTEIKVESPAVDPWDQFANSYFEMVRVLGVLDADHDGIISAREIVAAPAALAKLDQDHDGKLSSAECGFSPGGVMRVHPVLAALDADYDGIVSAAEIRNSPAALKTLDKNRDGILTLEEVIPDPVGHQAARTILSPQ